MTSEAYNKFAVAAVNSTEGAKNTTEKVGLLIIAEAWLELAEQTTQLVSHEAEEAHRMIERPANEGDGLTASCRSVDENVKDCHATG